MQKYCNAIRAEIQILITSMNTQDVQAHRLAFDNKFNVEEKVWYN